MQHLRRSRGRTRQDRPDHGGKCQQQLVREFPLLRKRVGQRLKVRRLSQSRRASDASQQQAAQKQPSRMRSPNLQCGETNECVMACTVSATRFSTPTLRISLATCALTVRSLMPNGTPISLLDRPSTSIFKTCVSRSVKATWSVGKIRRGELLIRSMNFESTRRGTQTEPRLTIRIACTKSAGDAAAST